MYIRSMSGRNMDPCETQRGASDVSEQLFHIFINDFLNM